MGKILILAKKSGFRDPARGGFTSTPRAGVRDRSRDLSGTPGSPEALSGPPPGEGPGQGPGLRDPDPGIRDPGDPGEPRRGLRDPPPPPGRGPEGLM